MRKVNRVLVVILVISIFITLSGCNKVANTSPGTNLPNTSNANIPALVKSNKTVELSSLKYEEINLPKDYQSVGWLACSNDFVFFSSGTDKPSKSNPPCLTYIEKLFSYNVKTKALKNIAEIDKGFVQIDWVGANDNWIVYREIKDEYGGPERIYAINRSDNKVKLVFENIECTNCEGVTSQHVFNLNLWNDYLVLPRFSFEPTKRDQNGKITDGLFYNSIKIINLKTNESKEIFNKSSSLSQSGAIFSTSINSNYLVFNYAEGGKQTIYTYSFNSGTLKELLEVPLMSDTIGSNNFLYTNVLLTEDNYIVFDYPEDLKTDKFLTVIAPIENINQMKSLFKTVPSYYIMWPQYESRDYIAWANRQEGTLNIINRNSGCLISINSAAGLVEWVDSKKVIVDYGTIVKTDKGDIPIEKLILINSVLIP